MKIRFRLTAFFSILFSVLLLFAVGLIYFFFDKSQKQDFNRRLWAQAFYTYGKENALPLSDSIKKIVDEYHPYTINTLQVMMLNGNLEYTFIHDKKNIQPVSKELLQRIKKKKNLSYYKGNIQYLGLYLPLPRETYIITSGFDKFGKQKVKSLFRILLIVSAVGMFMIVLAAIVMVNQVTKPLIRLGLQMQNISEASLQERIEVRSSRFNYEESQIASHFNAMLDRLERAFEIQRSFVHHASHELRTPLATMHAQTELALKKDLTVEDARKVLESLRDDQQEMIELTNSLLLLSRYEKDKTSPEWPVIRLDELLYDTMSMVKRMLPNVNVSLEFAQMPDNELFLSIQGNDSLIRSAFRNLIKNAWLYSDNKSVAITIDSTSSDIYLHFDNNGKLLSLEEQERLFVPFFRASNSTQKKGFGLGLNIIQRIVALHKGSIGYLIYNNLNRFTLQFPKLQSSANIEL